MGIPLSITTLSFALKAYEAEHGAISLFRQLQLGPAFSYFMLQLRLYLASPRLDLLSSALIRLIFTIG